MEILIVDDNLLVIKQIRQFLENKGHKVIESSNAMEALSKVLLHQPDLVITDLLMPYITGNELFRTINQFSGKKTNILFITSLQEKFIRKLDDVLKDQKILKKPINLNELDKELNAINKVLS